MKSFLAACSILIMASSVSAQDVLILGEIHDNPRHHDVQAERVASFAPSAIVFEMLTPDQARMVTPENRADPDELAAALEWTTSGWPDFAMYHPIFMAAPDARIFGAQVPRNVARAAFETGIVQAFGGDASVYGLADPLPDEEQQAREAMQMAAHCDALPADMLPGMVQIQRLRDAELARAVVEAMAETGGPVAVITGNGHARRDWGVPVYLEKAAPELELHVVGQTEDDATLNGVFDEVVSAPSVDRPDPCAAFK
jgi:uncharacterized iron-regulated protein